MTEKLTGTAKSAKTKGDKKKGWSAAKKKNVAKEALKQGHSVTEAADMAGLARQTVSKYANHCKAFMDAVREGRESLVNIALKGTVDIAMNPFHANQLAACQTLLRHERSGGYDGKSAVDLNIGWLPAGADREAFDV